MRNSWTAFLAMLLLMVLSARSHGDENPPATDAPDKAKSAQTDPVAKARVDDCLALSDRAAQQESLTLAESNAMLICHIEVFPSLPPDVSPGGILAHQPPPEFYKQWNFQNFPGILGGPQVNG